MSWRLITAIWIILLRDNINTEWEEGRAEGLEEGLLKGRNEGLKEANLNNAQNLKRLNVTVEVISQVTGLSKEGIEKL